MQRGRHDDQPRAVLCRGHLGLEQTKENVLREIQGTLWGRSVMARASTENFDTRLFSTHRLQTANVGLIEDDNAVLLQARVEEALAQ